MKEQKINTGVLFKNNKKETTKHPDYNGSINVDGTEYWLSAWVKQGTKDKFLSLSLSPKNKQYSKEQSDKDVPFI